MARPFPNIDFTRGLDRFYASALIWQVWRVFRGAVQYCIEMGRAGAFVLNAGSGSQSPSKVTDMLGSGIGQRTFFEDSRYACYSGQQHSPMYLTRSLRVAGKRAMNRERFDQNPSHHEC